MASALGNKAMNRTEALEDANLKIALAASMEAPGGSIFRDVLTDPDLALLVLGALVLEIDLSNNRLTQLPPLDALVALKKLDVRQLV